MSYCCYYEAFLLAIDAFSFKCCFNKNLLKTDKITKQQFSGKKDWIKSVLKILAYIYGATLSIVLCSVGIHFTIANNTVYELKHSDKINCCFLSQPLYLIVFFAFPVLIILSVNTTLFFIVFFRTKTTINHSDSEEMSHLFLKLATIMGLSWVVYVASTIIIEIFSSHLVAQIIVLISSCQINLQGLIVVLGLFSNATGEILFRKKASKNTPSKE